MPPWDANGDHAIVVAVDRSSANRAATRWAAEEALIHNRPLVLAHAIAPVIIDTHDPVLRNRIQRWRTHCARELLHDTKEQLAAESDLDSGRITTALHLANPVKLLTQMSDSAWMMVLGSRFHQSWGGRRFGSVSAAVSCRAHCPVAVIHTHKPELTGRPVIVGIDGSDASGHAAAAAFEEAARRHVTLVAVHAWSDAAVIQLLGADWELYRAHAEKALREFLVGWKAKYPHVRVIEKVYCDRPAHWLIEEAKHAGLVVVGSSGRGALSTFVNGSVAIAVAEGADVPVIITREGETRA